MGDRAKLHLSLPITHHSLHYPLTVTHIATCTVTPLLALPPEPSLLLPSICGKIVSTKLVLDAKKIGDHYFKRQVMAMC